MRLSSTTALLVVSTAFLISQTFAMKGGGGGEQVTLHFTEGLQEPRDKSFTSKFDCFKKCCGSQQEADPVLVDEETCSCVKCPKNLLKDSTNMMLKQSIKTYYFWVHVVFWVISLFGSIMAILDVNEVIYFSFMEYFQDGINFGIAFGLGFILTVILNMVRMCINYAHSKFATVDKSHVEITWTDVWRMVFGPNGPDDKVTYLSFMRELFHGTFVWAAIIYFIHYFISPYLVEKVKFNDLDSDLVEDEIPGVDEIPLGSEKKAETLESSSMILSASFAFITFLLM